MLPARRRALAAVIALSFTACGSSPKSGVTMPPPVPVAVPDGAEPPPPVDPPPAPSVRAEKVRELEGISEYRLPNGLQVLLFPDATSSTITVNLTYFVGSRHEGYGETGMAHLLEHLTYKGTTRYPKLWEDLERRGAQMNGSTWTDRTNYYATLPATAENLTYALDIEAERMRAALLRAEDLASEFSVVRSEFEMGENNPVAILEERVTSTAYLWHNYGKSTIGSRSDIERVPIEALRAFYDKYYQPDNAMLVVAGQLDVDATLAEIERIYGPIPRPERALVPPYTVEPVQDGERAVTLRRAGEVHVVMAAYHVVAGSDPDWPALECAADILTREPSGRLYGPLVKKKIATSVGSSALAFRDPSLLVFVAEARTAANAAKAGKQLIAAIEGLGKAKITVAEVERWRNDTLKDLALAMTDTASLAIELSEWAAQGDWRLLFAYRDAVKKVTPDDVQRVARTWFKPSNRTWGEFIPTKDADRVPAAEAPDVAKLVENLQGEAIREGEAFVASLDNLIARTQFTKVAGLDAALLPKATRGGKVTLTLTLRHGDETTLQGKSGLGEALAELVQRGTKRRSYQQLEDEQDRLKARVGVFGDDGVVVIRIETLRESLLDALALAAEMVKEPSLPADELEVVRQQTLAMLEEQRHDPYARGFLELARTLMPWPAKDPRYTRSIEEELAWWKGLSLADLAAFHKAYWGGGAGELVAVGDFDAAEVTAAIERHFGGWKSGKPYTRLADKAFAAKGGSIAIELVDKEMALIAMGHQVALQDTDADYDAALLASYMLGGGASSRLWNRLREKEGWSYGTAAWLSASDREPVGQFAAFAIMAPQNVAKARAAMLEEIEGFLAAAPPADEVERMRSTMLEQWQTQIADDGAVAGLLGDLLEEGRTLDHFKGQMARVAALTADQVWAAAKKHIDPDRLVIIEAADTAKGKANAAAEAAAGK